MDLDLLADGVSGGLEGLYALWVLGTIGLVAVTGILTGVLTVVRHRHAVREGEDRSSYRGLGWRLLRNEALAVASAVTLAYFWPGVTMLFSVWAVVFRLF